MVSKMSQSFGMQIELEVLYRNLNLPVWGKTCEIHSLLKPRYVLRIPFIFRRFVQNFINKPYYAVAVKQKLTVLHPSNIELACNMFAEAL